MAANPKPPIPYPVQERYHVYHAEAHVLSGRLHHPVDQPIEHHARVVLEKTRRDDHITQSVEATTLEGLISFKSGHTRASGSKIQKTDLWGNDHSGWVTLSTSVIEGLNVFEVITADRIVAQVSTEHSMHSGHVPKVTFLGTRFENLRVGGYPVQLELDLAVCGDKPQADKPYLGDTSFLDRVQGQLNGIATAEGLPDDLKKRYDAEIIYINDLKARTKGSTPGERLGYSKLKCSLVKSIGAIPLPGVRTFGNVIFIPDFGTVSLGEVEVGIEPSHSEFRDKASAGVPQAPSDSNYFALEMLHMHLGCIGGGTVVAARTKTNGQTIP